MKAIFLTLFILLTAGPVLGFNCSGVIVRQIGSSMRPIGAEARIFFSSPQREEDLVFYCRDVEVKRLKVKGDLVEEEYASCRDLRPQTLFQGACRGRSVEKVWIISQP